MSADPTAVDVDRRSFDVVVIGAGAGGAGLRAAIVCKSLFGKAYTVMAEGGIAASMATATPRTTGRSASATPCGGKFLNNPRTAELHAQEAPQRVWELETYGSLFDRTKDGRRDEVPAHRDRRCQCSVAKLMT